jgi:putative nucleotidyltransferase with HDIG domain
LDQHLERNSIAKIYIKMNLKMQVPQSEQPLPSVEKHTQATIKTLFKFLQAQGQGDYLGEKVTQLEHSLQCAHLAAQSAEQGHDMEVVLAALLHDVGRFIPAAEKMGKMVTQDGRYIGRQSHEILGEAYLRQIGFSDKVCQLVGAHVIAKRYLVTTDQRYYDGLSETSKRTLKFQVMCSPSALLSKTNRYREADSHPKRFERRKRILCSRPSSLLGDGMILPKCLNVWCLHWKLMKRWLFSVFLVSISSTENQKEY